MSAFSESISVFLENITGIFTSIAGVSSIVISAFTAWLLFRAKYKNQVNKELKQKTEERINTEQALERCTTSFAKRTIQYLEALDEGAEKQAFINQLKSECPDCYQKVLESNEKI